LLYIVFGLYRVLPFFPFHYTTRHMLPSKIHLHIIAKSYCGVLIFQQPLFDYILYLERKDWSERRNLVL